MSLDQPFPLDAVPSWLRNAILNAFQGRCPTMREVAGISDRDWLTVPGVGPIALEMIRSVPGEQQRPQKRLSDAELLKRLEWLQMELRWLEELLKARLPKIATGNEPDQQKTSQPSGTHA
jgi:hypothetical protein